MQVEVKTIQVAKGESVCIEPLGDIHVGNINFDRKKFEQCVERIRTRKNYYTVLMGDLADCIFPLAGEKRFDFDTIDPKYMQGREFGKTVCEDMYDDLYKMLKPIQSKILCVLTGNHDDIMRAKYQKDWVYEIANKLKSKYMGMGGFLKLNFQSKNKSISSTIINLAHGAYTGLRVGGNFNRIEDMVSGFEADIYLRGHSHQVGATKQAYFALNEKGEIIEKKRVFASTGSFLRGYIVGTTSYVELKDKRPTKIGTITIEVNPFSKEFFVHE